MQCDAAQGYLFARPLPPDQLGALLAAQCALPAAPALA
jgi:EAL domain-containing protein (putative c-di-GMP-specific phosphodiesterase class I)